MLVLALCYAEVSALLPVAGGIARIPQFSHGHLTGNLLGWTAWMGYAITAPIETVVTLQYLAQDFPWLYSDASTLDDLSWAGRGGALAILALFVVVNALGAAVFARTNTLITWFKLLIPLVVAVTLILLHFEPENFTAGGGFAPGGLHGILSAISAGGIIYAYLGFRHAIDVAGEVRRPQVTIPLALILTIGICALVYVLLLVRKTRGDISLESLDLKGASWLLPYGIGLGLLPYLGEFSGGLKIIPFGWDLLAGVVLSVAVFAYAVRCRLDPRRVRETVAEFQPLPDAGSP